MSILWNPAEATVVEKVSLPVITTGTQNMGDGIYWLKAGTPLDEDLAVANDGDAVYIVAEDFFFVSTNPNQDRHVPLVKAGYVDINKAEASAGITYDDAAVSALKTAGIELVDGLLDAGGGGGTELPEVTADDKGKFLQADEDTGELEWGTPSSGSGVLVVHVATTIDEYNHVTFVCDKTASEMWTAAQNGTIQFVFSGNYFIDTCCMPLTFAQLDSGTYHFYCSNFGTDYDLTATDPADYPGLEFAE